MWVGHYEGVFLSSIYDTLNLTYFLVIGSSFALRLIGKCLSLWVPHLVTTKVCMHGSLSLNYMSLHTVSCAAADTKGTGEVESTHILLNPRSQRLPVTKNGVTWMVKRSLPPSTPSSPRLAQLA